MIFFSEQNKLHSHFTYFSVHLILDIPFTIYDVLYVRAWIIVYM